MSSAFFFGAGVLVGIRIIKSSEEAFDKKDAPKSATEKGRTENAQETKRPRRVVNLNVGHQSAASLETIERALNLWQQQTAVAVIGFASEYRQWFPLLNVREKGSTWDAATGRIDTDTDPILCLRGTFFAVMGFRGKLPSLERVHEDIPFKKTNRWSVNHPLAPFLDLKNLRGEVGQLIFLGYWNDDAKRVMDGELIQLLSPNDPIHFAEIRELLSREAFDKMDEKGAEELLASPNPWKIYLGLIRLKNLKVLGASHFIRAMEALPIKNAEPCMSEMFSSAPNDDSGREVWTKALGKFFSGADKEKQVQLLEVLNEWTRRKSREAWFSTNLPDLRRLAEEYRDTIRNDGTRQEVVALLDEFIEWRPEADKAGR
jgi:hypothetical protein